MRLSLAIGLAAMLVASAAQAADRKVDDFVGRWIGTGQATEGAANPVATQSRDSEVVIERVADGFKVSWTTMSSDLDDGSKAKVKASSLTFKRTKTPGLFVDVKSGDPLKGKKSTWARITGDALTINQLVVAADGQWDVTTYERTLSGSDRMKLLFTRIKNGAVARQARLEMQLASRSTR